MKKYLILFTKYRAMTFRKDRVGKEGGGIIAYVNAQLQTKLRPDLMENDT